jgi:hypothetical protein
MLWTKCLYVIIFSDLDLAYINLNYMFHTSCHDNEHLCFNSPINDDSMVRINIFIFLSVLCLYVTLTLAAETLILHATFRLTIVNICAKLYWNHCMHVEVLLWTSVFQWPLSVTLTFDIETSFTRYCAWHWYEILLESLHMCRRYALYKISISYHLKWPWPCIC